MNYLILIALGVLSALPQFVKWLFFLPFFSFGAAFYVLKKCKKKYLAGLCFFIGYYVTVFHWFVTLYPMDFAGMTPGSAIAVIVTAVTFMSLMQACGSALVFHIYGKLEKYVNGYIMPLVGGCLFSVCEWCQTLFWFGVPWGKIALTQTAFLPFLQSVSLFGTYFIAFVVVSIGGYIALAFEKIRDKKINIKALLCAVIIFASNTAYGLVAYYIPAKNNGEVVCAVIQGNVSSKDKWADNSLKTSIEIYETLTREAVENSGAKLVVWPETVINVSLNQRTAVENTIKELCREFDCDIVVGAYYKDENEVTYNSSYLFRRDGTECDTVYKKRHLVPFGEYIPWRKVTTGIFPFLGEMNMFADKLGAGVSPEIMDGTDGKVGALVCFDSIYPALAVDSARAGCDIIAVSTNDSWYGDSAAIYEHCDQSLLRAIENGKCVVRAANTGKSVIIDGKGRELSSLGPLEKGYAAATAYYSDSKTLYTAIGDAFVYASFLAIIVGIVYTVGKKAEK